MEAIYDAPLLYRRNKMDRNKMDRACVKQLTLSYQFIVHNICFVGRDCNEGVPAWFHQREEQRQNQRNASGAPCRATKGSVPDVPLPYSGMSKNLSAAWVINMHNALK